MSRRRVFLYIVLPLLVLTALGSLVFWVVHSRASRNELVRPTPLATIALPAEPSLLAWSPDGSYLAAGTGYTSDQYYGVDGAGKVFIVDVGKQVVVATLDMAAPVSGLAFSPDGKWLAVTTALWGAGRPPELLVFEVPEFKAKLTAKELPGSTGYVVEDIAWAADGKSLYAIDGGVPGLPPIIRRWTAPEFREQPAISDPTSWANSRAALAVAPDGRTLAIVQDYMRGPSVLRLFDLDKGTKIAPIEDVPPGFYRAAFTADGKAVGVFAAIEKMNWGGLEVSILVPEQPEGVKQKPKPKPQTMSWWDVGTGKPASPANPALRRSAGRPGGVANLLHLAGRPYMGALAAIQSRRPGPRSCGKVGTASSRPLRRP